MMTYVSGSIKGNQIRLHPDPLKQAQEVISLENNLKLVIQRCFFNNNPVQKISSYKDLGMILDRKVNFAEYLKTISNKINKTFQENHYLIFLNVSLDHILTMVMSYLTKVTMLLSLKKLSNTTQYQLWQEPFVVLPKKSFSINYA